MYKQEISTHFFKFAQTDGVTVRLREVKAKDFNYRVEGDDEFIQYYYSNLNDENSSAVFVAEPINSFIPGWVVDEGRINVIQDIKNLKKPITIDDMGVIRDKNDESSRERDHRGESKTNGDFLIKKYEGLVKAAEKYEFAFTCKNKDLLNILKHYAKKSYVSICYYDKTSVEINGEKLQIIDNKFGSKFTDTSRLRTAYQDYCTYLNDYISHFVSNIPQSHILGITYFTNGLITIEDITAIKDGCTYQLIVAPIMGSDQLSNYHDELKRLIKSRKIKSIGKSDIPKTAEKPQQKEEVKEMTAKKTTKKTPAKKTSAKKTAGTTRTKGLHQTGTQTLEGRKMDLKIKAELPGKRTSATGKTYYEYRVNRTDMPTEREDFEKLFGKVKRSPAKKKTTSKIIPFNKKKVVTPEECGAEMIRREMGDYSGLPDSAKSAKDKKIAAKNFEKVYTYRQLEQSKKELMDWYDGLKIHEGERAKWDKMGDKRRVKYYDDLIKDDKDRISLIEKSTIPALEKELAKLMGKTPAKKTPSKKTSGTASASKSAKKKTSEKPENIKDAENAVLTDKNPEEIIKKLLDRIREKVPSRDKLPKITAKSDRQKKYAEEMRDKMYDGYLSAFGDDGWITKNFVSNFKSEGNIDKAMFTLDMFSKILDTGKIQKLNADAFGSDARTILDIPEKYGANGYSYRPIISDILRSEGDKLVPKVSSTQSKLSPKTEQIDEEIKKLSAELSEYLNRKDFTIDGYNKIKDKIDALEKKKLELVPKPTMKMVDNLVDKIKAAFPSSLPEINGVSAKQEKYANDLRKNFVEQMDTHWSKVLSRLRTRVEDFSEKPNTEKANSIIDVIGKLERVAAEVFPAINADILKKTSAREIIDIMQKYRAYGYEQALKEYISKTDINLKM